MKNLKNIAINSFLRTFRDVFKRETLYKFVLDRGFKITMDEVYDILSSSPYVFELEDELFCTRAGVFTNRFFSICPTAEEIRKGVFVIGHRCMPFIDPEIISSSATFLYNEKRLNVKSVEFTRDVASRFFYLYGEEYVPQYIAADPANAGLNLVQTDFDLPPKVFLTCVSLEDFVKNDGFSVGDRILCRVVDWDECIIDIYPVVKHKKNHLQVDLKDLDLQDWNSCLENYLLSTFKVFGPCSSIEEQLADTFFEHRNTLCGFNCGSIEECLSISTKVAVELFGVETRLWKAGVTVPAVGEWNKHSLEDEMYSDLTTRDKCALSDYIINSYLKDLSYQKIDDLTGLIDKFFPESVKLTPKERKTVLLHLQNRNAIILKDYNWFADFSTGALRHRALLLFSKINSLILEIDSSGRRLDKFPQTELVILSQLYSHLSRMLETIDTDANTVVSDFDALMLSVEGMEYNFEDVESELRQAIDEEQQHGFEIVK